MDEELINRTDEEYFISVQRLSKKRRHGRRTDSEVGSRLQASAEQKRNLGQLAVPLPDTNAQQTVLLQIVSALMGFSLLFA